MKQTKRKAFNFLRSYFDVFNQLETDKDKLSFLTSIINKQFLDEDPNNLDFVVKLSYESQRHQVESSVKGWKRASNTDMTGEPLPHRLPTPPTTLPTHPPTIPKEEEEQGEEKEELIVVKEGKPSIDWDLFLVAYNTIFKRKCKVVNSKCRTSFKARLKEGYTNDDIRNSMINVLADDFHKENGYKHATIEYFSRSKTLDMHMHEPKSKEWKAPHPTVID